MYAAISADIVSSTSLSGQSMVELTAILKQAMSSLKERYNGFWGRVFHGDSIECIIADPADSLEIAIFLKALIKSFKPADAQCGESFTRYGLRVAIGLGEMKTINHDLDIMDGEAIYRSGRTLATLKGRSKYSLAISMSNSDLEEQLQVIINLVNLLLNKATARRSEILCQRLLSASAAETARHIGISKSGVNQALNELGWSAIEQSINYFHKTVSKICWHN